MATACASFVSRDLPAGRGPSVRVVPPACGRRAARHTARRGALTGLALLLAVLTEGGRLCAQAAPPPATAPVTLPVVPSGAAAPSQATPPGALPAAKPGAAPTQAALAAAQQVVNAANALMTQGRSVEAIPSLEKLTQEQPTIGQGWYLLGAARHMAGQLDRALEAHLKASAFPDVRALALYNVACVHALRGRTDEAFAALKTALADPKGAQLRTQMIADNDLQSLRSDARWLELVQPPQRDKPFVEDVKLIHVWHGESAGEQFGWEAVDAGDVDGDGVHDVLASAPFHRAAAAAGAATPASGVGPNGRVAVYSGRSGALLWGRVGEPGEQLGVGISGAGDTNGDGIPDVIVGASSPPPAGPGGAPATPADDAPAGRAYLLSGRDGALLRTLDGESAGDQFGDQVRGLGDVDGDGVPDLAVSAPFHDGDDGSMSDAGRVLVFSGRSGEPLFALDGERSGDHFGSALGGATWPAASGGEGGAAPVGSAVSTAGLGPRAGLLLVGAMDAGAGRRGRVSVFHLRDGGAEPFFAIDAEPTGASLGQFFASVIGDLDGDGVPDVYATDFADAAQVGTTRGAAGRVFLHSGKDGHRLATIPGHSPSEGFGIGNAQAGDVNRDGVPDLVVGAWTSGEGAQRAGKAYVLSGKDRSTLATFTCALAGDEFGFDATGLGDVDGDGAIDFLITAASSNDGGPQAGRVYVISGAGVPGALPR